MSAPTPPSRRGGAAQQSFPPSDQTGQDLDLFSLSPLTAVSSHDGSTEQSLRLQTLPSPTEETTPTQGQPRQGEEELSPTLSLHHNLTVDVDDVGSLSHRAKWLHPQAFVSPRPSNISTVDQALRTILPRAPDPYKKGALTSTKDITQTELNVDENDQLEKIVYVPTLVTCLRDRAVEKLQNLHINWDEDDDILSVTSFHPYTTARNLPRTIWSEKDIEHWTHAVLFRPAVAAVRAVMLQDIKHDFDKVHPYVSSSSDIDVIPDGMFVLSEEDSIPTIGVVIENKTPSMWEEGMDYSKLEWPEGSERDIPAGTAMRFYWPTKIIGNREQDRVIVQAWTQLVKAECDLGIISTLNTTIFLARGRGNHRNTLYISPAYRRAMCPIYAVFCWFAIAAGIFKYEDLNLPTPDASWWNDSVRRDFYSESPGVCAATYYTRYLEQI
ncbi:hypothetical protein SCP_1700250 [Sparassis crispa]|uniref:Uncharacterized protein n=1 Tax=Sparassis crispa TaxID=139825 RepID=A0A401H5M7_9APHY|nr:hypothetical protein SCP_1700250 [Sparassis crispa]GBE89701.1 hypothetical protein SCP_1700250 [Sparassis crispa]